MVTDEDTPPDAPENVIPVPELRSKATPADAPEAHTVVPRVSEAVAVPVRV